LPPQTKGFTNCVGLSGISFPTTMAGTAYALQFNTTSGVGDFVGCTNLKTIKTGVVTGVQPGIFSNVPIENVTVQGYIDYTSAVGSGFKGVTSIKSVTIDKNVTTLGVGLFENCTGLEEVTFLVDTPTPKLRKIDANAFKNTSIKKVDLDMYATGTNDIEISGSAFSGCVSLGEVDLNMTIAGTGTQKWDGAFSDLPGLRTVTLGTGIAVVPVEAFQNSNRLSTFINRTPLTSIKDYAFDGCTSLASAITVNTGTNNWALDYPDLGIAAFRGCEKLTSVTIQSADIDSIAPNTFEGSGIVSGITAIGVKTGFELPATVQYIMPEAFKNCKALTYIDLTNMSTGNIQNGAFEGSGLKGSEDYPIIAPSVSGGYGFNVFKKSAVEYVNFANPTMPAGTFEGCVNLKGLTLDGTDAFTSIDKDALKDVPAQVTLRIATFAGTTSATFTGQNSIRKLIVKDNVLANANNFNNCANLEWLTIERGGAVIAGGVLQGCPKLKTLEIVENQSGYAFSIFSTVENVIIGKDGAAGVNLPGTGSSPLFSDNVKNVTFRGTSIGIIVADSDTEGFGNLEATAKIELAPLTDGTLGGMPNPERPTAFENRLGFTRIEIGDKVASIQPGSFHGCVNLVEILVSNHPTFASRDGVLYSNKDRTRMHTYPGGKVKKNNYVITDIPENVTEIGVWAIGYTDLVSITVPENVVTVGNNGLNNPTTLTSVTLRAKNLATTTANVFGTTTITSVIFGEDVESIPPSLFNGCANLTSVTFPNKLKSIWDSAFAGTGLTKVVIPASVGGIGGIVGTTCFPASVGEVTFMGANTLIAASSFGADVATTGAANGTQWPTPNQALTAVYPNGGAGVYIYDGATAYAWAKKLP
jgi:hypothetical protein